MVRFHRIRVYFFIWPDPIISLFFLLFFLPISFQEKEQEDSEASQFMKFGKIFLKKQGKCF